MIIRVDEEGKSVITQLCDIALRTNGIANLNSVNDILSKVEVIKPVTKDDPALEAVPKKK